MKKNKKFLVIIVLLLLFTVSIGYAIISRSYDFKGTINIKGNKWDIAVPRADEIEETPSDPSHPVEITTDEETGDVTISYHVNLENPGDQYVLAMPIRNAGTMNAIISGVETTGLTSELQKYLTYSITAEDGTSLDGKTLAKENGSVKVKIVVKYRDDNQKELPENDVTGIELKTVLQFTQN